MADDEALFVEVWSDWWAKIEIPRQLVAAGAVRRLDVGAMLGKTMPKGTDQGRTLLDGIFADIKSLLKDKDGAAFWSPAPGLIDIFYPKLQPLAADLSHSVVRSTVERRVRDLVVAAARVSAPKLTPQERRIGWEAFQQICYKAQAKPDQIQNIDISELCFGMPDPNARMSRRSWGIVDGILDEFLEAGGYCTRVPGNQVLMFFPGLSASLARLKRNSITKDIERAVAGLTRRGEATEPEAEPGVTPERERKPAAAAEAAPAESPEEVAKLNRAFATLSASGAKGAAESSLTLPDGIALRMVPIWRAGNQTLVGHTVQAAGASNGNPEAGTNAASFDALDLPILAQAKSDLSSRGEAETPHLVIVPVHWPTLERLATRTKYFEVASQIPDEARRYLVLLLQDVPTDLLAARVDERARELRRFCRTIMCQVDLGRREFDQLRGQQLHAIGAELATDGSVERDIMAAMDGFLDALAPLKVKSFIRGLHTKSLVIAALAAGFDYLSGSAIADSGGGAQSVRAFSIPDLYETSEGDQL